MSEASKCPFYGTTFLVREGCTRCGTDIQKEEMTQNKNAETVSKAGEEPVGSSPKQMKLF